MLFFSLILSCLATFRPDHEVVMSVVAPWDETPIFEQILFFLTDLSTSMARDFLQKVLSQHDQINNNTFLFEEAYKILPSIHHQYLRSQIEIGFFQPRGEMYRELARNKGGSNYPDIIVIGKELPYESETEISKNEFHYLASDDLDIEPFELQFGIPKSIVYANFNSSKAGKFVLNLIENNVEFSLRPTTRTGKFGINLRGFGIEMRPFKYSMEYGVKDSIVLDATKDSTNLHEDPTVKRINGLPESYSQIAESEDFSARFTAWLRLHANESYPELLRDFSNNYPLFLNEILNTTYDEDVLYDLQNFGRFNERRKLPSSINGREFPIQNLDIFNLLTAVNEERALHNILSSTFKLNETQLKTIFGTNLDSDYNLRFEHLI